MQIINRKELQQMLERGRDFILIDAQPEDDYEQEHLPYAINVPLDDERFVCVRGVDREGTRVSVTSELVAGDRLSDIIEARSLGEVYGEKIVKVLAERLR